VPNEHDLLESQLSLFLDPEDEEVREQARRDGIAEDWIEAARRSPVYALAKRFRVALPLHPEYRTLPMVWYVPPLSPVESLMEQTLDPEAGADDVFGAIEDLRIPVDYLASFLAAGDPGPVRASLRRLATMRAYMRAKTLHGEVEADVAAAVGMEVEDLEDMYQQVAIADYDDRYVLPKRHGEVSPAAFADQGSCGLDFAQPPGAQVPDLVGGAEGPDFDLRDYLVRMGGKEGSPDGG
jgi:nitrate reductase beta subunit